MKKGKKPEKVEECFLDPSEFQMDYTSADDNPKLPFDLKAKDFVNFAEEDITGDEFKDLVNALSNIKRALENRMDTILFLLGYSKLIRNWNFPDKIKKLNDLEIIAPRILTKINKIRNLLEHEYKLPKRAEVEDALDVAILFIESTKNYIKRYVTDFGVFNKKHAVEVFFKGKNLLIEIYDKNTDDTVKLKISAKDKSYDSWIKFIIKRVY